MRRREATPDIQRLFDGSYSFRWFGGANGARNTILWQFPLQAIVSFDCFGSFSTPSPIYVAGTFVFPIGCILDVFLASLMVILSPTF